ncbi:MAG: hypothetical protein HYR91_07710 [Flavobacteriia bacterium]|nr:hypothetical protein [Flavobacteriia bacterium]
MIFFSTIFFFTTIFLTLRYYKPIQLETIPKWTYSFAFALKVLVGYFFIYIYIYHYPTNTTPSDAIRFMKEAEIFNHVFYKSPKDYFLLLFNLGNEKELVSHYLNKTFLWDAGSLTIVNDSRNAIRFHSLLFFISKGNPLIHIIIMCCISMIGLIQIFQSVIPYTKIKPLTVFIILLFIPSILFWTSSLLKEPLLFLGIGLIIRVFLHKDSTKKRLILLITSILILTSFKPYVIICLLPALLFYFLYKHIFLFNLYKSFLAFSILLILSIISFSNIRNKTVYYLSMKQYNFDASGKGGLHLYTDTCFYYINTKDYKKIKFYFDDSLAEITQPLSATYLSFSHKFPSHKVNLKPQGEKWLIYYFFPGANSYFTTTPINFSFFQLIKNIPEALTNAYFRPFIFDKGSQLKYPAIFEVWILTIFILYSIINSRKLNDTEKGIITSLLIFSLFLLLLIGWTTPVSGAIFRYRFPAQLALLIIGLIIIKPKKLFHHE